MHDRIRHPDADASPGVWFAEPADSQRYQIDLNIFLPGIASRAEPFFLARLL
jgi:hypothetical protein